MLSLIYNVLKGNLDIGMFIFVGICLLVMFRDVKGVLSVLSKMAIAILIFNLVIERM